MRNVHRFPIPWIAAAVLAVGLPVGAAEVERYLPQDTEMVVVINAEQLFESAVVKKHLLKPLHEWIQQNAALTHLLDDLDFDPFEDLTSITVALTMVGSEAKGLIVVHGDFDESLLAEKAEEVAKQLSNVFTIHRVGEQTIYEVNLDGSGKPFFIGIVDDTTIVAGPDKHSVQDAFAKSESKKHLRVKKELRDLIEQVNAEQSVWLAGTAHAFLKGEFSGDERSRKNLQKMTGITAGLTVDRGLHVAFAIAATSAANAKDLAQEISKGLEQAKTLLPVVAGQHRELTPLLEAVANLRLSTRGNTITLEAEVGEEVVENSLRTLRK